MEEKKECPICLRPNCLSKLQQPSEYGGIFENSCDVCGKYLIHCRAEEDLKSDLGPKQRVILSSIVRNRYERKEQLRISSGNKKDILDSMSVPSDPFEKIDLLLEHIAYKTDNKEGMWIDINFQTDYPILFTEDHDQFEYCIFTASDQQLIEIGRQAHGSTKPIRLTLQGWRRINELKKTKVKANQAFVAMWFDSSLTPAWEDGFKRALKDAGFSPIRIDMMEHNNKICDEIIANIRKSGLVITDFTGQRGGVYFEAGYAMGLGIPVIWTCRDTDINDLHFDTRQYNHIAWGDPKDLREKLKNRIEATIPRK